MEPKPCDCKHEGWPRTASNLAIAAMFASLFWAMAWVIVTVVGR